MKFKRSITTLGSVAVATGSVALMMLGASPVAHAGIANTKHNLGTTFTGTDNRRLYFDTTEICVFCHTPHMSVAKNTGIPLWNHQVSTVASYGVYSSDTFNGGTPGDLGTNNPADGTADNALDNVAVSNLCLSCHDGTVAVNALYNASNLDGDVNPTKAFGPTANGDKFGDWNSNLGNDLTNDHPVNFSMQTSYNEESNLEGGGSLYDPSTLTGVRFFGGAQYEVQCPSCHDPHIDYSSAGNTAQQPFLRVAITGSTLCLKCHKK